MNCVKSIPSGTSTKRRFLYNGVSPLPGLRPAAFYCFLVALLSLFLSLSSYC